jgi:DNA-binding MarR family transcriptional regulator
MKRATDPSRGLLDALLDLRLEMAMLNRRVAAEVGLNEVDLDCLELLSRHGPTSPARLTRRLGIHPATMTGILARLEASGWIKRSAHPNDKRASVLCVPPGREARLRSRYASATKAVMDTVTGRPAANVVAAVRIMRDLTARARNIVEAETTPPSRRPGHES